MIDFNKCECGNPNCDGRNIIHEKSLIEKYGFFSHLVMDDLTVGPSQTNYHTHGIPLSQDHHDIQIIVALPPDIFNNIIHSVFNYIKKGNKIETNKKYDGFIHNFTVEFTWAIENDRDVLRMILPDPEGRTSREEISFPYTYQWMHTYDEPQMDVRDSESWLNI